MLTFLTAALLIGCVGFAVLSVLIVSRFETTFPIDPMEASGGNASPRFVLYEFEKDRSQRIGEAVDVTNEVYGGRERIVLSNEEIPELLKNAFIAIEDKRFYRHGGVDWRRTGAAALNSVIGFSPTFGGSGITQQLVKNLTGRDEVTAERKIQEILYAIDLDRRYSKDEILTMYLNAVSFSDSCVGVGSAAKHYFGKTAEELTPAEAASLAAIVNSPSRYHPRLCPEENIKRRNLILSEMEKQGYLSHEEAKRAEESPLILSPSCQSDEARVNSWYADMVIDDVIRDLTEIKGMTREKASGLLFSGGVTVEIAMDREIQKIVGTYYENLKSLPENAEGVGAQSALIVIDAGTGDVLAVAGAVGEKQGNRVQNYATKTLRPPGSSIKPLTVYAPALEKGLITWSSVYDDVPVDFGEDGETPWPKNADGRYRGLCDISYAVAHSTNTVAVRVLKELGLRQSFEFAKNEFGLESLLDDGNESDCDVAPLALGQLHWGVTLRELTAAYTAFADGGTVHRARSYYRVVAKDGTLILNQPDSGERILSRGNAAVMTKLLEGVVREGTSSSVTLNRLSACAGKTGTSQGDCDRWFIGYTPELVCGVWCGYEYPEALTGRNLSTGIWNDVMWEIVSRSAGKRSFDVPSEVITAEYCPDSGDAPGDGCRLDPRGERIKTGYFVRGTEPKSTCTTHKICLYDPEGEGRATAKCPHKAVTRIGLPAIRRSLPMSVLVEDEGYRYFSEAEIRESERNAREEPGRSDPPSVYQRFCPKHEKNTVCDWLPPQLYREEKNTA